MDSSRFTKARRLFASDPRSEIEDELEFHLEERARDNIARGMSPEAARAAAQKRLGDLHDVRKECTELLTAERRAHARRVWLNVSWLDFKLGLRMLVKYPGLTLVGGFAMAFAIWVGAGSFELIKQFAWPTVPLPAGDRIVRIANYDVRTRRPEHRAVHDFALWRDQLESVTDLGAYRMTERNLAIGPAIGEPAALAEISASAFRMARVRPLLGRTLVPSDEDPAAPAVMVIGHDLWQRRFDGAADIIGQTVRLGNIPTTIVGVMPDGFAFPVAHHMWVPLRLNPLQYGPREGPEIMTFARLADGVSLKEAQAEATALGKRLSTEFGDTHEYLRPVVRGHAQALNGIPDLASMLLMGSNVFLLMLLVLICANVALLMFARAATRESEIVVRNALGASRGRIIAQLFVEALVLGVAAAVVGLSAVSFGLRWALNTFLPALFDTTQLPFWFRDSLSPSTIVYALLLTVIAAAVAGVLPALKVTRGLQSRLRETATGSALTFGGVWTAIIVAQIAVTVVFPVTAFAVRKDQDKLEELDLGIPEREYLTAKLELDRRGPAGEDLSKEEFAHRFDANVQELKRRLLLDPSVAGVAYADLLPRMYHPAQMVDVDAGGAAPKHPQWPDAYRVSTVQVDPGFFTAINVPLLSGRAFTDADLGSGNRVVIVNQSFVKRVLGGRNPIGRRVRFAFTEDGYARVPTKDAPWHEIIGVVPDLGMSSGQFDPKIAGFYIPTKASTAYPARLIIRVKGDAAPFAARLRAVSDEVDPTLRVYEPTPLNHIDEMEKKFLGFWFNLSAVVSGLALLLSLSGIYAVMAFTVARRTREIGIRVALGSSPLPVIRAILRRPLLQVTAGIATGALLIIGVLVMSNSALPPARHFVGVGLYALLMLAVCLLACIVPTRRALKVQPTQALRAEA